MTFRTTVNQQRGVSVGGRSEGAVLDRTQNGGLQGDPGPQGPIGPPLRLRGELSGLSTPLPVDAAVSDYWILRSPVPTAAPARASGAGAQQGDWIALTEDGWINVGPLTVEGESVGSDSYNYIGATPSASHVINHGLGFYPAGISVVDLTTRRSIDCVEIQHSVNQLELQFNTPRAIEASLS